ncbi:hypothetical protein [Mycobacterium sp. Aquia_213]|uniref:hypothetical protein n=1 Tax=Mycobacterium sp. Aquia_213 TaxID=2991728 RepID=UPI00226FF628|nr:hypothetical protein [Mycobacterium sp. Aquia_213]WAC92250.1 hypothetical protein LMQ14_03310 [Mycobacterium sp. Aquia_213]
MNKKFAITAAIVVAVLATAVLVHWSTAPSRDERSYQAGYHEGAPYARSLMRAGTSAETACQTQAINSNVWNPEPYSAGDYLAGCLDALAR